MNKRLGEQLARDLGIRIPIQNIQDFDCLDPNFVDLIAHKSSSVTTWEEVDRFLKLKQVPPSVRHKISKALKLNPVVPNKSTQMHQPARKKKWNVLRQASHFLDEITVDELKVYLGQGLKTAIRKKIDEAIEQTQEDQAAIDVDSLLIDLIFKYLGDDLEIAEAQFGIHPNISLENVSQGLPHLITTHTPPPNGQTNLPL